MSNILDYFNIENNIVWEQDPTNPLIVGYLYYGSTDLPEERQKYNIVKITKNGRTSYWLDRNIRVSRLYQREDLMIPPDMINNSNWHPKGGYMYNWIYLASSVVSLYSVLPFHTRLPTELEVMEELSDLTVAEKETLNLHNLSFESWERFPIFHMLDSEIITNHRLLTVTQKVPIARHMRVINNEFYPDIYKHFIYRKFGWKPEAIFTDANLTFDVNGATSLLDWWNNLVNLVSASPPQHYSLTSGPPARRGPGTAINPRGTPYPTGYCAECFWKEFLMWVFTNILIPLGFVAGTAWMLYTMITSYISAYNYIESKLEVALRCKVIVDPDEKIVIPGKTDPIFFGSGY